MHVNKNASKNRKWNPANSIRLSDPGIIMTAAHCLDTIMLPFIDMYIDLGVDKADRGKFVPDKSNQFKAIKLLKHSYYKVIQCKQN